jgi:hypothetical protein
MKFVLIELDLSESDYSSDENLISFLQNNSKLLSNLNRSEIDVKKISDKKIKLFIAFEDLINALSKIKHPLYIKTIQNKGMVNLIKEELINNKIKVLKIKNM